MISLCSQNNSNKIKQKEIWGMDRQHTFSQMLSSHVTSIRLLSPIPGLCLLYFLVSTELKMYWQIWLHYYCPSALGCSIWGHIHGTTVKPLFFDIGIPYESVRLSPGCSTSYPYPGKAAEAGPIACVPESMWETQIKSQASGFGLAQFWL